MRENKRNLEAEKESAAEADAVLRATKSLEQGTIFQRKLERAILAGTICLVVIVGSAVWLTDGKILKGTVKFLQKFESEADQGRNAAKNCMDVRNRNTPYCQDRAGQAEQDWRGITRNGGGGNAFKLTDK